ncbi:MAG: transcription antitermination factor NusB [Oscillospiraceae bacterium]|nr:transcription antitermination factor NusB [Oscillospiraceae bacterium]
MTQREKREAVFLLLYQSQLNDDTVDEIIENNISEFELVTEESVKVTFSAVADYTEKADEVIARFSKTRAVSRIAKICVAVMRLAIYEMDCRDDLDDKIAINEAIELCKKYADKQDCNFVSGLLGSYYREKHEQ